jgi:hypothetical protein
MLVQRVMASVAKTVARSVSRDLDGAYNRLAYRTRDILSRLCRGETVNEFRCWAFICVDALTIDKLYGERHGVRKDMPVFPCF